MKTGLEIFLQKVKISLRNSRIGLCINHTSLANDLKSSLDLFNQIGVNVTAVFSPEHGLYGIAQDMEPVHRESKTESGIRHFSLYGESKDSLMPTQEMMDCVDVIIFDIQDIGARYYTFIYTLSYCMEACKKYNKGLVLLDRPNPIRGDILEGNILKDEFRSFVGRYPLLVRHGMTVGELALMFNQEFGIGCKLDVIKMSGWKRNMRFYDTGLTWIAPSPNMPTLDTALLYPGMCLFEGTNVSEGRGTTKPFEYIGAPWINAEMISKEMAQETLAGVVFKPMYFKPMFNKYKSEICGGVHLYVKERKKFRSFLTGIALIKKIMHLYPQEFKWRKEPYEFEDRKLAIDLLLGNDKLRKMIEENRPLNDIEASYKNDVKEFDKMRKKYLLYN